MSIQKQWCLFSAGALVALGLSTTVIGCREEPQTGPGGAGGEDPSASSSSSSSSSGGAGGTAGAGGAGGAGGGAGGGDACSGTEVTLDKITNPNAPGAVGKGTPVFVKGVVAMSPKFLVSQSNSGTCLYGVFVSAPGLTETEPYSGIMVVSRGNSAVIPPGGNKAFCAKLSNYFPDDPLPGDAIPDDVKPGDILNITGVAASFLLNACANEMNGSKVPQAQLSFACKVEKMGTAPVPTPHEFKTPEELVQLASPTDADFHQKWGGVKVRVGGGVGVVPQTDPGGGSGMVVVGDFGVITLAGSNLEVGDKIYYRGYDKQTCHTGPQFSDLNIKFNRIDGFSYLSYCTWGLEVSNKCADFDPASEDCTGITCQ